MAISFVSAGAIASPASSVTPALPAGYQAGDILICCMFIGKNTTQSPPTGYTLITNGTNSTNSTCYVWYKVATASESSPSVTTGGTGGQAVMLAYRGSSGIDATATPQASGSATTITPNNLTTTAPNDFVLTIIGGESFSSTTITPPGGVNTRVLQNESGSQVMFLFYDELQTSAGLYTAKTSTMTNSKKVVGLSTSLFASSTGNMFLMF